MKYCSILLFLFYAIRKHVLSQPQNVRAYFNNCTLYIRWSPPMETSDCKISRYSITLVNEDDNITTSIETKKLFFSMSVSSSVQYRIKLYTIYSESSLCTKERVTFQANVSTKPRLEPDQFLQKNISDSFVMECSLKGAYVSNSTRWKWTHHVGTTPVRQFDTSKIEFLSVSPLDIGKYTCTVSYRSCPPMLDWNISTGLKELAVTGKPYLLRELRSYFLTESPTLSLVVQFFSFPEPRNEYSIKTIDGQILLKKQSKFHLKLISKTINKTEVEIPGYHATVHFNISNTLIGRLKIELENNFGISEYAFAVDIQKKNKEDKTTVNGQETFSKPQDVRISFQNCTLFVKWSAPKETSGCNITGYSITILSQDTTISQAETVQLSYSMTVNSLAQYNIRLITRYSRSGSCTVSFGKVFETKVSTEPTIALDKSYQKNISDSVSMECTLGGAYLSDTLKLSWQHRLGSVNVRTFNTSRVQLRNITPLDTGTYICSVTYQLCLADFQMNTLKGTRILSVSGTPYLFKELGPYTVRHTTKLSFTLEIFSFPDPAKEIVIRDNGGNTLLNTNTRFDLKLISIPLNGIVINIPGYNATINIKNISIHWIGQCSIELRNDYGISKYNFSLKQEGTSGTGWSFDTFLKEHVIYVTAGGAGILLLFVITIITAVCCDIRRKGKVHVGTKKKSSRKINDEDDGVNNELYARPFSFGEEIPLEEKHRRQIENERKQIASLYSFGGFSVNEFDDETPYGNQYAPEFK